MDEAKIAISRVIASFLYSTLIHIYILNFIYLIKLPLCYRGTIHAPIVKVMMALPVKFHFSN